MNQRLSFKTGLLLTALSLLPQLSQASPYQHIVVANRNSGTLGIIGFGGDISNLSSLNADNVYDRDTLGFEFEPTYVSEFRLANPRGDGRNLLSVADRRNSKVHLLGMNGRFEQQFDIGKGPFHLTTRKNEIYVATDVDKGFNFIEGVYPDFPLTSRKEYRNHRFELPAEFQSGNPHDIIGSKEFIYLTIHGVIEGAGTVDYVLQVYKKDLSLIKTRKFNSEVHLFDLGDRFAILEQQTGLIHITDSSTFDDHHVTQGPIGVHGVNAKRYGGDTFIFVTDIDQADGENSVLAYKLNQDGSLDLQDQASTTVGTAHNIGLMGSGVFITHSGPQSAVVSILEFNYQTRKFRNIKAVYTGLNPFGITEITF